MIPNLKQLSSQYSGNHKSIFLVPIGDLHLGNKYYNRCYLQEILKFVDRNRSRCRILLMGDLLELATKGSVGRGVYDEKFPTQKQYELAVQIFSRYAELIDIIVEGNHEERIIKDTSFEIVQEFAHKIGRPEAYAKFNGIINFKLSEMVYSAYVWHGSAGGITDEGAIKTMLKMRERVFTHLYFMGHTHKLLSHRKNVYLPNPEGEAPHVMEQLFVNTGTALGDGGYGAQKGMPLQSIGFGYVEIFRDYRKAMFHRISDLV